MGVTKYVLAADVKAASGVVFGGDNAAGLGNVVFNNVEVDVLGFGVKAKRSNGLLNPLGDTAPAWYSRSMANLSGLLLVRAISVVKVRP